MVEETKAASRSNGKDEKKERNSKSEKSVKYSCDKCEYIFVTLNDLKEHTRFRHGEKPFVCQTCGVSCRSRPDLNIHVENKHSWMKPPRCDRCKLQFKNKKELAEHDDKYHVVDIRLNCSLCDWHFNSKNNLNKHVLSKHNRAGVPRSNGPSYAHRQFEYECFDCGNRFSSKSDMWSHKRNEHPYVQRRNSASYDPRVSTKNRFDPLSRQGN